MIKLIIKISSSNDFWTLVAALSGAIVGALLTFFLTEWIFRIKRKLKSHWQALKEEAEICREKSEEFVKKNITAPLYRLPILSYKTSFPVILAINYPKKK